MTGGAHLQNQNYLVTENLNVWFKFKDHKFKDYNDSHNYHDENILYQEITKRNTQ